MTDSTFSPTARDRRFYHLASTETWERFSLHGVKALLTLYLIDHVLAGGADAVIGLAPARKMLEALSGPLTPLAFASQLYGLYAALSYLVLPIGGAIGDRVLGRRRAVVLGALTIASGHLCLMREALLLPALALLIAGTGCMKANLSAQVGDLFPAGDDRRNRAFAVYLAFLNIGVMLGPLVCGLLAQQFGWRYAFGAAALGMAVALTLYLSAPPARSVAPTRRTIAPQSGVSGTAIAAIGIVVLAFCAYKQVSNIFLVWIAGHIRLDVAGFAVPPAWFAAADGFLTILLVALVTAIGRAGARRGHTPPCSTTLLALGSGAIGAGFVVLAAAAMTGSDSALVPLAALVLLDLGVVLVWPAGLALVTASAPAGANGTMVGLFYLHGFFANLFVGWVGGFYERVPIAAFWGWHAAIAGVALLLALAMRRVISRRPIRLS
ncbi:MFS transporter [Sphingomonas sp. RB3P16]|uniref:POT-type proton-dependent oligopeptide transporter n=1 Tax=Parasphingomonas frigoris TaxID=3096163 RepID=UPI002FCB5E10